MSQMNIFSSPSKESAEKSSTSLQLRDRSGVRVVVRVRPFNERELIQGTAQSCVSIVPQHPRSRNVQVCTKPTPKQFTFDYVADPQVSQEEMFEFVGRPVVDSCISGINGTVFCYGQTGAGKTYTMLGPGVEKAASPAQRGLIPRMIQCLFDTITDKIRTSESKLTFLCKCSFLEIYNDTIADLLESNIESTKNLQIREDLVNGVYVENLIQENITSAEEAVALLKRGIQNRHTSSTMMNAESSRSHSVFTIVIQSREESLGGLRKTKTARLNLIDLAGSERQQSTKAEGDRLTEACSINKSLSALGKVIMSLVDIANGKNRHVHYRDSKLTFLLKDSLGGNSKTCIIANISPSYSSLAETLSTLQFAQRAKYIRNQPTVNENMSGNVQQLQEEIFFLRAELAKAQAKASENKMITDGNESGEQSAASLDGSALTPAETTTLEKALMRSLDFKKDLEDEINRRKSEIENLNKIIEGQTKIMRAAIFLLKVKETQLADREGRKPTLSYLENNIDFGDDEDDDLQGSLEDNLTRIEKLTKVVFHPENHPTVCAFVIENLDLRERLQFYEMNFRGEYDASQSEISKLKKYVDTYGEQITKLVAEKHAVQERLMMLEDQLMENSTVGADEKFTEQLRFAEDKLAMAERENEELQEKLRDAFGQIDTAIKEKQELEEISELAIKKAEYSLSKLNKVQAQLEQREKELQQVIQERMSAPAVGHDPQLEEKYKTLSAELEALKEASINDKDMFAQKQEELLTQITTIQESEAKYKKLLEELQLTHDDLLGSSKQQTDSLVAKIEELEQSKQVLQQQLIQAQDAHSNISLEAEAALRSKVEQFEGERSRIMEHLASVEHEKQMKDQQLHQMHSQIAMLSSQIAELDSTVRTKEQQVANLSAQMTEAMAKADKFKEMYEQSKEQFDLQEYNLTMLVEQLAESNVKLKDTEEKLTILQQHFYQPDPAENSQLEKLKTEIESLRTTEQAHQTLKQQFDEQRQQLNQLQLKYEALHQHAEKFQSIREQYEQQDKEHQERIRKYKGKIKELREGKALATSEKNNKLAQDFISQKKLLEQYKTRVEELTETVKLLQTQAHATSEQGETMEQMLRDSQTKRESLAREVQNQRDKVDALAKELAQLRSRNTKLEAQNAQLSTHQNPKQKIQYNLKIKEENNQLRKEKQDLENKLIDNERISAKLKSQLKKLAEKQGTSAETILNTVYGAAEEEAETENRKITEMRTVIRSREEEVSHIKQQVFSLARTLAGRSGSKSAKELQELEYSSFDMNSMFSFIARQLQEQTGVPPSPAKVPLSPLSVNVLNNSVLSPRSSPAASKISSQLFTPKKLL